MNRKYNDCMKYVVENHRDEATKIGLSTSHLTDEQVFDLIERNTGYSTSDEDLEAFLNDLKDQQPTVNKNP